MKVTQSRLKEIIRNVIAETSHMHMAHEDMPQMEPVSMSMQRSELSPECCMDACAIEAMCEGALKQLCIDCWCMQYRCSREQFLQACSQR